MNYVRLDFLGILECQLNLTDSLSSLLKETATQLKGVARRRFQAQTVMGLGYGGQLLAQKELGWDRKTIQKGIKELTSRARRK